MRAITRVVRQAYGQWDIGILQAGINRERLGESTEQSWARWGWLVLEIIWGEIDAWRGCIPYSISCIYLGKRRAKDETLCEQLKELYKENKYRFIVPKEGNNGRKTMETT